MPRVRVAVVDTGISATALGLTRVPEICLRVSDTGRVRVWERSARDCDGHGTICAAILLSLAPEVELWSLAIIGADREANLIELAAAIHWCATSGIDVVSISLGTRREAGASLGPVCAFADARGTVLVASSRAGGPPSYPAALPAVLSVGSAAVSERALICRPGQIPEFVTSGDPAGLPRGAEGVSYIASPGSSFAVPRVAARVALLKRDSPSVRAAEARAALYAGVGSCSGLDGALAVPTWDNVGRQRPC